MSEHNLTLSDPLHKRILAWIDERFPFANAILFFVIYLCVAAIARFSASESALDVSLVDVIGCLITWSFFLVLRVFDEHKDFELDVHNHPDRVLQSGLITLNHLRNMAIVSIAAQVVWSFTRDSGFGPTMISWCVMFFWTCLMGKEFFCGEWLEKRLTLYAFSHMLVMLLIVWWISNMAAPGLSLTPMVMVMMSLSFFGGFCFEITRKTRGPEEERDTVDSYSKVFGTRGSACVVIALLSIMLVHQVVLMNLMIPEGFLTGYVVMALCFGLAIKQLISFIKAPSEKGREKNEAMIGINMLGGYVMLITAVIVVRGVNFSVI